MEGRYSGIVALSCCRWQLSYCLRQQRRYPWHLLQWRCWSYLRLCGTGLSWRTSCHSCCTCSTVAATLSAFWQGCFLWLSLSLRKCYYNRIIMGFAMCASVRCSGHLLVEKRIHNYYYLHSGRSKHTPACKRYSKVIFLTDCWTFCWLPHFVYSRSAPSYYCRPFSKSSYLSSQHSSSHQPINYFAVGTCGWRTIRVWSVCSSHHMCFRSQYDYSHSLTHLTKPYQVDWQLGWVRTVASGWLRLIGRVTWRHSMSFEIDR